MFNESECFDDPVTWKSVRRLTENRDLNQTPTYHPNLFPFRRTEWTF